jgi:hypothetical protein
VQVEYVIGILIFLALAICVDAYERHRWCREAHAVWTAERFEDDDAASWGSSGIRNTQVRAATDDSGDSREDFCCAHG